MKAMIRAAICDDEKYFLQELSEKVTDYFCKNQIEISMNKYADGNTLLNSEADFDIVFLDIRMSEPDGIETARKLRLRGYGGYLIFVTVLRDEVFGAFEFGAFDYLVKPLDEKRFRSMMDRLIKSIRANRQRLFVQTKGEQRLLTFGEILYCEVIGHKIELHLTDGSVITYYDKIDDLEKKLDSRFFKSHRSFLVNLEHVRGCRQGLIALEGEIKVPLSRLRAEDFRKTLTEFMSGKGEN